MAERRHYADMMVDLFAEKNEAGRFSVWLKAHPKNLLIADNLSREVAWLFVAAPYLLYHVEKALCSSDKLSQARKHEFNYSCNLAHYGDSAGDPVTGENFIIPYDPTIGREIVAMLDARKQKNSA